jgi:transposase
MRMTGCGLHAAQQSIAMLDCETGEIVEKTLTHEPETVRAFYGALPRPVVVGLEATGSMGWFLHLLDELGITYRVGHPATIRKAETRKQKHDRRDAALLLQLLAKPSVSGELDALDRAAGSAGVVAAPSPVGADAYAGAE